MEDSTPTTEIGDSHPGRLPYVTPELIQIGAGAADHKTTFPVEVSSITQSIFIGPS